MCQHRFIDAQSQPAGVEAESTFLRAFEPADLAGVVALSLRAWAPVFVSIAEVLGPELFSTMYPDWRVEQRRSVESTCTSAGVRVRVATRAGQVVGFVAVAFHLEPRIGEISMIAVDPAAQRHGIGRMLTEDAHAIMRDAGMTLAKVDTGGDPGHAPARRLYERTGHTLWPAAQYYKRL